MVKLGKQQLRQRGRELRSLLTDWDPIGVGPNGPKDEYDCILWPIMRLLEQGATEEALAGYLERELSEHFGVDPGQCGSEELARHAKAWFEKSWAGSRV